MKITCAKHLKDFNQHAGRMVEESVERAKSRARNDEKCCEQKIIIIIWLLCSEEQATNNKD